MCFVVKVTRFEKENPSSLIRRFSMRVKESGILAEVRQKRYYRSPKTERQKKDSALWRNKIGQLRRKLLKIGEVEKGQKIDRERIRKEFQKKD